MPVTRISVGRVFNLGNYEHVRYEITADVPEGESAAVALLGVEKIIEALKPERQCGVKSESEIERERESVAALKKDLAQRGADDFRYRHISGTATPEQYIETAEKQLAEAIERRNAYVKRNAMAREYLDNLGGACKWKDAKLDWENSTEADGDF